jgi:hypothetical protein
MAQCRLSLRAYVLFGGAVIASVRSNPVQRLHRLDCFGAFALRNDGLSAG